MTNSQRKHWEIYLLGLLLLFTASGGMPLSKEDRNIWQHGKDTSQRIIQKLWELGIKTFVEASWSFKFPQRIECNDSCDPDSLNGDKMPCLRMISQRLLQYHDLLSWLSDFESESKTTIAELEHAVGELQNCLPTSEGGRPIDRTNITRWEFEVLRNETIWRLESFSVVVARVFAHCAAMTTNLKA